MKLKALCKPADLNIYIRWIDGIGPKKYLKGTPRKLNFVCSVEWAWSPMNNRIANYYINPKPWGWALWDNRLDDHDVPWSWWWDFLAYSEKTNADAKNIATPAQKTALGNALISHYHYH